MSLAETVAAAIATMVGWPAATRIGCIGPQSGGGMLPEKVPESALAVPTTTRKAASSPASARNLRRIERSLESTIRGPGSAYSRDLFAANLRFLTDESIRRRVPAHPVEQQCVKA